MYIVAIDPGASGGFAWQGPDGINYSLPMPETREGVLAFFKKLQPELEKHLFAVYLEKVSPFIPDGGASQMMEYGRRVEMVTSIPLALGFEVKEVPPKQWQKELGLGASERKAVPSPPRFSCPKGSSPSQRRILKAAHSHVVREFKKQHAEEIKLVRKYNDQAKTRWKASLLQKAKELFPEEKITLKTCDAFLLLAYGVRMNYSLNLF